MDCRLRSSLSDGMSRFNGTVGREVSPLYSCLTQCGYWGLVAFLLQIFDGDTAASPENRVVRLYWVKYVIGSALIARFAEPVWKQ